MKCLVALFFSSCAFTAGEAARYITPNYLEIGVAQEADRPSGWDASVLEARLGWYLQPVPTRPSYGTDRGGHAPEPLRVIQPETQEIIATLVENQKGLQDIQAKTVVDQFGQREAMAGGAAVLLALLTALLRHFKLKGNEST